MCKMSTEIRNPISTCVFIFGIISFTCGIIRLFSINYNEILFYTIAASSSAISFAIIQILYFRTIIFSINYILK